MNGLNTKSVGAAIVIAASLFGDAHNAHALPLVSENFNSGDGGFTVVTPFAYDGPWVYAAGSGSWKEDGQAPENSHPNTSMLNSPGFAVLNAGAVTLSFTHRYSFEGGFWDGGQVRMSLNGGAYTTILGASFSQNGYNGTVLANSASVLAGQAAFIENSPNFSTTFLASIANLGSFNAGDTLSIQFIVGNDTNTRGQFQPNWEITDFSLTGADATVPETVSTLALLTLAMGSLVTIRRFFPCELPK